jgi:hypothetical protein
LFIGTFPAGISYADRAVEEHGDYKAVAFLSYETLELEVRAKRSPLLALVREHAKTIQARRGEQYQVSASGQTVLLGGPLPRTLASEFRVWLADVGRRAHKTPEQVYALWREYAEICSTGDQSALCSEFEEWYRDRLRPVPSAS